MTVHSSGCVLSVYKLYRTLPVFSGHILTNMLYRILDFRTVTCRQFSTWHSLHGKPLIRYQVRATSRFYAIMSQHLLLYYIFQGFASIFLHFFNFFQAQFQAKQNALLQTFWKAGELFGLCFFLLYVEAFPLVPFTGNACDNDTTDHNYSYNYNCHNGSGRNTITTVTLSAFTLT